MLDRSLSLTIGKTMERERKCLLNNYSVFFFYFVLDNYCFVVVVVKVCLLLRRRRVGLHQTSKTTTSTTTTTAPWLRTRLCLQVRKFVWILIHLTLLCLFYQIWNHIKNWHVVSVQNIFGVKPQRFVFIYL